MHETYFLSQNLAFLGIYIFNGEFDTLFSYLDGFVSHGINIYEDFATLFSYLGGFLRLCIALMTSLSLSYIYIYEEFTTLFPYPSGFVRLGIYIEYSEKFAMHLEHLILHPISLLKNGRDIMCIIKCKVSAALTLLLEYFPPTPLDVVKGESHFIAQLLLPLILSSTLIGSP
jgi:hypothetical protein